MKDIDNCTHIAPSLVNSNIRKVTLGGLRLHTPVTSPRIDNRRLYLHSIISPVYALIPSLIFPFVNLHTSDIYKCLLFVFVR